ncbi:MAG: hypothetical protein V2A69_08150 [Pseudomonadota bacterium]
MEEKRPEPKKISMSSTKQEMIEAYNALLKQLQERREGELKPEKKLEEKKAKEAIQVADALSAEGIAQGINNLKLDIGKVLTQISDRLEGEVNKYKSIQSAIGFKEGDLQELYEIEKSALTLSALIESQNQKRQEFEAEIANQRETLKREIGATRTEWEKEESDHEAMIKEREAAEKKRREREREEFEYAFKKEQQLAKDKFEYEKGKLEKDIQTKKQELENTLKARESAIAEREEELSELRKKAGTFPKEMETAIAKAIKETSERLTLEAKNREEFLKKEFEGERNVLKTRIESLEKTVKEQSEQISRLSQQMEAAYQKVQDIAVKTVEGSSGVKAYTSFQQLLNEQVKRQLPEK